MSPQYDKCVTCIVTSQKALWLSEPILHRVKLAQFLYSQQKMRGNFLNEYIVITTN